MHTVLSMDAKAAYMRARLVTGSQKPYVESLDTTFETRCKLHRPPGASS